MDKMDAVSDVDRIVLCALVEAHREAAVTAFMLYEVHGRLRGAVCWWEAAHRDHGNGLLRWPAVVALSK